METSYTKPPAKKRTTYLHGDNIEAIEVSSESVAMEGTTK